VSGAYREDAERCKPLHHPFCTDGMVVTTQIRRDRKGATFDARVSAANHPLDCPGVRPRAASVNLQEMTFDWAA